MMTAGLNEVATVTQQDLNDVRPENPERALVHRVPIVGADGLTEKQRAAVGGVGLCSNCQQPKNSHLPGCAQASGEDPRARTKDPLPPVA